MTPEQRKQRVEEYMETIADIKAAVERIFDTSGNFDQVRIAGNVLDELKEKYPDTRKEA